MSCYYLRDGRPAEGCRPNSACWTEACGAAGVARPAARGRPAAVYRIATATDHSLAVALARCTFPPGSASKRFARELPSLLEQRGEITDRQAAFLRRLVTIYRRQIDPVWLPSSEHYLLTEDAARALREAKRAALPPAEPAPHAPAYVDDLAEGRVQPAAPTQLGLF